MIVVKDLGKDRLGHPLLDGISFSLSQGESAVLLGPRNAGKSLLLLLLSTIVRQNRGSIEIAGYNTLKERNEIRHQIGLVPKSPPLYPELSPCEYLEYCANLRRLLEPQKAAARMKDICRLSAVWNKKLRDIPAGIAQQLNLAQAMIHQPQLLLIDDIFSDGDLLENQILVEILRETCSEKNLLLATHNLSVSVTLCSRAFVLSNGRLLRDIRLADLGEETLEVYLLKLFSMQEAADANSAQSLQT